ncbi:MAG: PepSY domain-containing protein [Bryobacteraceae bacterium]
MLYKWLRNTHLLLGLFGFLFLTMYAVSSVQMVHRIPIRPSVSETMRTVTAGETDARRVARELMDRYGLGGDLLRVRTSEKGASFDIVKPGTVSNVDYDRASGEAKVRTSVVGLLGMLNRIHHVGGLWHEYALINVWGALVGLVSASLVVMALTGIYLWFKIHTERAIGVALLAISLGYSVTLMVLMRNA